VTPIPTSDFPTTFGAKWRGPRRRGRKRRVGLAPMRRSRVPNPRPPAAAPHPAPSHQSWQAPRTEARRTCFARWFWSCPRRRLGACGSRRSPRLERSAKAAHRRLAGARGWVGNLPKAKPSNSAARPSGWYEPRCFALGADLCLKGRLSATTPSPQRSFAVARAVVLEQRFAAGPWSSSKSRKTEWAHRPSALGSLLPQPALPSKSSA